MVETSDDEEDFVTSALQGGGIYSHSQLQQLQHEQRVQEVKLHHLAEETRLILQQNQVLASLGSATEDCDTGGDISRAASGSSGCSYKQAAVHSEPSVERNSSLLRSTAAAGGCSLTAAYQPQVVPCVRDSAGEGQRWAGAPAFTRGSGSLSVPLGAGTRFSPSSRSAHRRSRTSLTPAAATRSGYGYPPLAFGKRAKTLFDKLEIRSAFSPLNSEKTGFLPGSMKQTTQQASKSEGVQKCTGTRMPEIKPFLLDGGGHVNASKQHEVVRSALVLLCSSDPLLTTYPLSEQLRTPQRTCSHQSFRSDNAASHYSLCRQPVQPLCFLNTGSCRSSEKWSRAQSTDSFHRCTTREGSVVRDGLTKHDHISWAADVPSVLLKHPLHSTTTRIGGRIDAERRPSLTESHSVIFIHFLRLARGSAWLLRSAPCLNLSCSALSTPVCEFTLVQPKKQAPERQPQTRQQSKSGSGGSARVFSSKNTTGGRMCSHAPDRLLNGVFSALPKRRAQEKRSTDKTLAVMLQCFEHNGVLRFRETQTTYGAPSVERRIQNTSRRPPSKAVKAVAFPGSFNKDKEFRIGERVLGHVCTQLTVEPGQSTLHGVVFVVYLTGQDVRPHPPQLPVCILHEAPGQQRRSSQLLGQGHHAPVETRIVGVGVLSCSEISPTRGCQSGIRQYHAIDMRALPSSVSLNSGTCCNTSADQWSSVDCLSKDTLFSTTAKAYRSGSAPSSVAETSAELRESKAYIIRDNRGSSLLNTVGNATGCAICGPAAPSTVKKYCFSDLFSQCALIGQLHVQVVCSSQHERHATHLPGVRSPR